MNRPRTQKPIVGPRQLTANDIRVLSVLERYRFLDTPHIGLLLGWTNRNLYYCLERLFGMGLIEVLPNNRFGRDQLASPLVYAITGAGSDQLSERDIIVHKATWLKAGNYKIPVHNLNLCLSLCDIELAHIAAGLRFISWGEILAAAPEKTQQMKNPHVLPVGTETVVPDAIFATEYPDAFALTFYELDLSNHGEKEYRDKFEKYESIIFGGIYKDHFGMKQRAYVNTLTTAPLRLAHMQDMHPKRRNVFRFKCDPRYGSYQGAPKPNLGILDGWQVNRTTLNLGKEVKPTGHPKAA